MKISRKNPKSESFSYFVNKKKNNSINIKRVNSQKIDNKNINIDNIE